MTVVKRLQLMTEIINMIKEIVLNKLDTVELYSRVPTASVSKVEPIVYFRKLNSFSDKFTFL